MVLESYLVDVVGYTYIGQLECVTVHKGDIDNEMRIKY
jgi:hypothetical protein